MIKESITSPQAIALAAMMFTWGLSIQIREKSILAGVKVLWFISIAAVWVLM